MTEGDQTRRIFVNLVTRNFFDTFGVRLVRGRTFTAEEERPGADLPVTILSYNAWQRLGGGDDVIGRTLKLNGRDFTVIGVAPRGFGGSMVLVSPELWLPTGVYDTLANDFVRDDAAGLAARAAASLADPRRRASSPGATPASIAPALASGRRTARAGVSGRQPEPGALARAAGAPVGQLESRRPTASSSVLAVLLFGMSGLVLLVASLNLANMLLARGSARRKEFALRLALGGTRLAPRPPAPHRKRRARRWRAACSRRSSPGGRCGCSRRRSRRRLPVVIDLNTTPGPPHSG